MFAAVGSDGTREVVWGVGKTEDLALTDATEWLPEDAEKLRIVEITGQVARMVLDDGIIDTITLGIGEG